MTLTLAPVEIKQVRSVWDHIKQDETRHCSEILIRMFEQYPDILAKFDSFKDVTFDEMRNSSDMRAHVGKVLRYLGAIIAILDEPHLMVQTTYMLGAVHKQRKATREDFKRFQREMIDYTKEQFGSSLEPEAFVAFDKLLHEFVEQVSPHLIG